MDGKQQNKSQLQFAQYQIYNKIKSINASKILYIDDSSVALLAGQLILKTMGYHIRTVSNLSTLILEIEDFLPDIFIIDMVMPKCNGLDLLHQIKDYYSKKAIYICTTMLDNNYDLNEISKHFDYFIPKPLEKNSFSFLTIGDKIVTNKKEQKPSFFKKKINKISKYSFLYNDPYPIKKGRLILQGNPSYQSFLDNINKK